MNTELLNKYKVIEPMQNYWINMKLMNEYRTV